MEVGKTIQNSLPTFCVRFTESHKPEWVLQESYIFGNPNKPYYDGTNNSFYQFDILAQLNEPPCSFAVQF